MNPSQTLQHLKERQMFREIMKKASSKTYRLSTEGKANMNDDRIQRLYGNKFVDDAIVEKAGAWFQSLPKIYKENDNE